MLTSQTSRERLLAVKVVGRNNCHRIDIRARTKLVIIDVYIWHAKAVCQRPRCLKPAAAYSHNLRVGVGLQTGNVSDLSKFTRTYDTDAQSACVLSAHTHVPRASFERRA
jgi:hypothetical protein